MTLRHTLTSFHWRPVGAALLVAAPAAAQLPCQAPTQVVTAQSPTANSGFGQNAAVQGDTALVLSEQPNVSGAGPVDVHVVRRGPGGAWTITQVLTLAGASNAAPGTQRVHLDGDVAAVTFDCSIFGASVRMLERDPVTGLWSQRQALFFPGLSCVSTSLAGDQLAVGLSFERRVQILERNATGDWVVLGDVSPPQPPAPGTFSSFGSNVALSANSLVVADEQARHLYFYEGDFAAGYSLDLAFTATLSGTFGTLGRALDLDGERLVVSRVDGAPSTTSKLEHFRRTPGGATAWAHEDTLSSDPGGERAGFGYYATGAGGTVFATVTTTNDCAPGLATRIVMAREPGVLPGWRALASVCPQAFGAALPFATPLDYDGRTLLLGLSTEDVGGVPRAGRVAIVDVLAAEGDCDGDCTPDALQLAACAGCDVNGNGRLDVCERRGDRYCDPATPNATGAPGRLDLFGSASATSVDLVGHASFLPAGSFGLLVSSRAPAFLPGAGGSAGTLCLGGPGLGRFAAQPTGAGGAFTTPVDPQRLPAGGGTYAVQAGDTVYFQAWYRDGATSNLTDAVALTF